MTTMLLLMLSISSPELNEGKLRAVAEAAGAKTKPKDVNELDLRAPVVPPWPKGLPSAQTHAEGTFLPAPLDKVILERLIILETYPMRCQARINAVGEWGVATAKMTKEICDAECSHQLVDYEVQAAGTWSSWEVLLLAVGIGIAAGGAGFAVGYVLK